MTGDERYACRVNEVCVAPVSGRITRRREEPPMPIRHRLPTAVLAVLLAAGLAACSGASPTQAPGQAPSVAAPSEAGASGSSAAAASSPGAASSPADAGDPYAAVDVCGLATAAEVTAVMGETAHDAQESMIGPGASIAGAHGCTWQLGDSIDLFDLWIYPAASSDLSAAMGVFWNGYTVEPLSGYGDEAVAAVWRGDKSMQTVGQVAGVGVRQGDKVVLLSTLLLGTDDTDPKPAAQLAVKILGRF
jgi:hypothetical protein